MNPTGRIVGNQLWLANGRAVAIYTRDGAGWVAELRDDADELYPVVAWMSGRGRLLVHARRRGEVETVESIPAEIALRIERLHGPGRAPGASLAALLARLVTQFRIRFIRSSDGRAAARPAA